VGGSGGGAGGSDADARNYVLANGAASEVGPGYRVDLNGSGGQDATLTFKTIKSIVSKGQTIVLTQERDRAGAVKNSIVVGGVAYVVDAGHLDNLPVELRPLGEQLVSAAVAPAAMPAGENLPMEERVKELEDQNRRLQEQLAELIDLVKKQGDKK
jgi:hypothetical protein